MHASHFCVSVFFRPEILELGMHLMPLSPRLMFLNNL
jgi:hypothetical protein